jgi:hypothetical protein
MQTRLSNHSDIEEGRFAEAQLRISCSTPLLTCGHASQFARYLIGRTVTSDCRFVLLLLLLKSTVAAASVTHLDLDPHACRILRPINCL